MLDIFYYVKTDELQDILNYGIKLSDCYTRKINIQGNEKLFLTGLLNPKDDINKFKDNEFTCVRLKLNLATLKIAEGALYNTKYYEESLIPFTEYMLGEYMQPEVLISMSILPEIIEEINYNIDYPILYDNSKELYVNNLIEKISMQLDNANDIMLNSLLKEYAKKNDLKTDNENNINIYFSDDELYISK